MLRLDAIRGGYRGTEVLKGIDFEVREGDFVTLLGSNGAGKSTTVRAVSGLLKLTGGRVEFAGQRIDGMPPGKIARLGLVQVPEGRQLFTNMTVLENLSVASQCAGSPDIARRKLDHVFRLFPRVEERKRQVAKTLSGGEQQMVAVARAMMADPKLLILDEPSLGLAPLVVRELMAAMQRLHQEGLTILLVEQNVRQSLAVSNYAYIMENGRIVEHGPSKELAERDSVRKAYLGR